MSRTTYVLRDGKLVEKSCAPAQTGVYVISDTMAAAAHPCTGQMMDSKSRFRRTTREHGCIEVGDQSFPARGDPYDAREMKRTIAEAIRNPDRSSVTSFAEMAAREGWR